MLVLIVRSCDLILRKEMTDAGITAGRRAY